MRLFYGQWHGQRLRSADVPASPSFIKVFLICKRKGCAKRKKVKSAGSAFCFHVQWWLRVGGGCCCGRLFRNKSRVSWLA